MFKVITNKPIAYDSPDHLNPFGSVFSDATNKEFNRILKTLFNNQPINIMDMGCAGGSFIADCINDGYFAIGLEGSDEPIKRNHGQWVSYACLHNKNLFTCDVIEPFEILYNDCHFMCDVITSWEFLEHIHTNKIDQVLQNTINHLKVDGLYICSASATTQEYMDKHKGENWGPADEYPDRHFHHQNQTTPEYWDAKFASFNFIKRDDIKEKFKGQFVRGPGHNCSSHETEERMYTSNEPKENLSATINRVYQYKG